jgi:hypothetical protein
MAQAARSNVRSNNRFSSAQRGAIIAKRMSARRSVTPDAARVGMVDPAMLAACIDAGGFADHASY